MADIIHRVGVKAPVAKVFGALASIDGLSNWWTRETSGGTEPGQVIEFKFRNDDGSIKGEMHMQVTKIESANAVHWRCQSGPPDWIGTSLTFELKQEGEYTILLFGHRNWESASESMAHCSTKWATFLLSLRDYVEKGRGKPAPEDIKIDNWN